MKPRIDKPPGRLYDRENAKDGNRQMNVLILVMEASYRVWLYDWAMELFPEGTGIATIACKNAADAEKAVRAVGPDVVFLSYYYECHPGAKTAADIVLSLSKNEPKKMHIACVAHGSLAGLQKKFQGLPTVTGFIPIGADAFPSLQNFVRSCLEPKTPQ